MLQLLTIQHESASWIKDAIRLVFWTLTKGVLILLDGMFEIINDIWKFKFFDNPYVNKIYNVSIIIACTWLILKVIIELIMRYFINQDDNTSPTRIFKGIITSVVMIFLIPLIFNWGYDVSSKMTQYVISASSSTETTTTKFESSMSSMILAAFADNSKMEESDKTYFIENWFTIDYNDVMNDGLFNSGQYKYSFHTFSIFIVGWVVVGLLFFIGIQVAKRIIELALYKAIAPFVCTSLVTNKSRAFEVWIKGVIGTFLVTAVQYLCIGILFNVFGSVVQGTTYTMSVILIVIGALLFIISSPQLVSALLNANTGALSGANELHSMVALGTSMMAMSRYRKTVDNSTNSNNDDNSSSSNGTNATTNFSSSNLDSKSQSSNQENYSNSNLGNNNSNQQMSNNDIPSYNDNSYSSNTTSLADRIDTYKDMIDNNYSFNQDINTLYTTTSDWGDINVSNT